MSEQRAYGCLFCITGKEIAVAEQLQRFCPGVRAIAARRERYRSFQGKKSREEVVFLPGYVFFEAPVDAQPRVSFPKESVIRLLWADTGRWQLDGEDEYFARWLFAQDGLLNFSKAYKEGEQIRIFAGPLKDMEGHIRRIDRRGRSAQVNLAFNGRSITIWLGFDVIDPVDNRERRR